MESRLFVKLYVCFFFTLVFFISGTQAYTPYCDLGYGWYYDHCSLCLRGTYSDEMKKYGSCKVIPAGAYGIGSGIAPKYWVGEDVVGADRCTLCDINSWSEEGNMWINYPGTPHTWSSGCTACPEGKYGEDDLRDPDTCTGGLGSANDCSSSCAAGTARPAEVGAECEECDAGTYSERGAGSCTDCDEGDYSARGAGSCTTCDWGEYWDAGDGSCSECVAGKYAGLGVTSCTDCPEGQYNNAGSDICTGCGGGDYWDADANSCSECVAGKYSSGGTDDCTDCGEGWYSGAGSGNCASCVGGYYWDVDATSCSACLVGKYSESGAGSCTDCGVGRSTVSTGSTLEGCLCDVGYAGTVDTQCAECDAGYAKNSVENKECDICTAGWFSPTGSSTCSRCSDGSQSTPTVSDTCIDCIPGWFKDSSMTTCQICAAGMVTDSPYGSTGCTACPENTYSSIVGHSGDCTPCPTGSTTLGEKSRWLFTQCFCGIEGREAAHQCAAGSFSDMTSCNDNLGIWDCKPCAIGTYNPVELMDVCYDCPEGMTTSSEGSVGIDSCVCTSVYGGDFAPIYPVENTEFLSLLNRESLDSAYVFSRYNHLLNKVDDLTNGETYDYVFAVTTETIFDMRSGANGGIELGWGIKNGDISWVKYFYSGEDNQQIRQVTRVTVGPGQITSGQTTNSAWLCFLGMDQSGELDTWPFPGYNSELGGWSIAVKYDFLFELREMKFENYADATNDFLPGIFQLHGRVTDDGEWVFIYEGIRTNDNVQDIIEFENVPFYSEIRLVVSNLIGGVDGGAVLDMKRWVVGGSHALPRLMTTSDSILQGDTESNSINQTIGLYGTAYNTLKWTNKLPIHFTMCWTTRWTGSHLLTYLNKDRDRANNKNGVLQDNDGALYGHFKFSGGVVKGEGGNERYSKLPSAGGQVDMTAKWWIQCFTNTEEGSITLNSGGLDYVVIDQTSMGWKDDLSVQWPESDNMNKLSINPANSGKSFFQIHSVYVWNGFLDNTEMKVVTAAIRSELGGVPYDMDEPTGTPLVNPRIYNQRIVAAARKKTVSSCMSQYPPIQTRSEVLNIPTPIQYRSSHPTEGYSTEYFFDVTARSAAYATGTYTIKYNSNSMYISCPLSNILFQPVDNDCTPTFEPRNFDCSTGNIASHTGSNELEAEQGDWVVVTFPEAFVMTDFQIDSRVDGNRPEDIRIYGLGPDLSTWIIVYGGPASVGTRVDTVTNSDISRHRKTDTKFYTYRLLVTSLYCGANNQGALYSIPLRFNSWRMWGVSCAKGKYADNNNEDTPGLCTECPIGFYSTAMGRSTCLQCPNNMTTVSTGSTSITECVVDSVCAAGHYVDVQPRLGIDVIADGDQGRGYSVHMSTEATGSVYIVHNFTHVRDDLQHNQDSDSYSGSVYTPYTIRVSHIDEASLNFGSDTVLHTDILLVGGGGGGGGGQKWGCGGAGGGGEVLLRSGELLHVGDLVNLRVGAGGSSSTFNQVTENGEDAIDGSVGGVSSFGVNQFTAGGGGGGGSVSDDSYQMNSTGTIGVNYGGGVIYGGVGCAKSTDFTKSPGNGGACVGSLSCGTDHLMAYCGGGGGAGGTATDPVSTTDTAPHFCEKRPEGNEDREFTVTRSKGGVGLSYPEFGENVHVGGGGSGTGRDYTMGGSSHGGGKHPSANGQQHTGGGGVGGGGVMYIDETPGVAGNGGSGTILMRVAVSICKPCPPGSYSESAGGGTECTLCPVGTFASSPGSVSCEPCAAGSYALVSGHITCGTCPPGQYFAINGAQEGSCDDSPKGTFTAVRGSMVPTTCPRNMTTLAIGSTSISDCVCEVGMYNDPYGFCVECTPGSTSPINSDGFDTCACAQSGVYKSQNQLSAHDKSCGTVVTTGETHTCVLFKTEGEIKCWGGNSNGQLGNGNAGTKNEMGENLTFVDFGFGSIVPRKVVSVQAGMSHTCVLFDDNMLKCFGANHNGQLGMGDIIDRDTPDYEQTGGGVDIGQGKVISIHLGSFHTCVLLDTREVKCFGLNQNGQLGLNDTRSRGRFPNEMGSNLPVVYFGTDKYAVRLFNSGGNTMCALLNTAELKCWGGNEQYALGMGISARNNIGDEADELGDNLVAIELPTGKNVVNVWVGSHVVVLFDDHTMATWGRFDTDHSTGSPMQTMGNQQLQIIHPGDGRKPVQVMLNRFSIIVLFDNGDVVGLGMNQEWSLGLCTLSVNDPAYHVSTQTRTTGGVEIADTAAFIYFDERSPNLKVKGLSSNSFSHFCIITAENEVICWGANNHGQLGWPPEGL